MECETCDPRHKDASEAFRFGWRCEFAKNALACLIIRGRRSGRRSCAVPLKASNPWSRHTHWLSRPTPRTSHQAVHAYDRESLDSGIEPKTSPLDDIPGVQIKHELLRSPLKDNRFVVEADYMNESSIGTPKDLTGFGVDREYFTPGVAAMRRLLSGL